MLHLCKKRVCHFFGSRFRGPVYIVYRIEAEKFTGSKISRVEFQEAQRAEDSYFLEVPLTLTSSGEQWHCRQHVASINVRPNHSPLVVIIILNITNYLIIRYVNTEKSGLPCWQHLTTVENRVAYYQRCYQDQGVRDQDQTKTRQAETETETKSREAKTKTKTKTSRVETKTKTRPQKSGLDPLQEPSVVALSS